MGKQNDNRDEEFARWLADVSRLCGRKFGLTLRDLPDMMTRDAFDSGTAPETFFEETILPTMREDFGSLVDEL